MDDIREYILKLELRFLLLCSMPFLLVVIADIIIAVTVLNVYPDDIGSVIAETLFSAAMFAALDYVILYDHFALIPKIKSGEFVCKRYIYEGTFREKRNSYRGMRPRNIYYHTCQSIGGSTTVSYKSNFDCFAKAGQEVYAVKFRDGTVKLYTIK